MASGVMRLTCRAELRAKWRWIIWGWAQTATDVTMTSERMNQPCPPPASETKPVLAVAVGASSASRAMPSSGPPTLSNTATVSMQMPTSMTKPCMASV